MPEMDYGDVSKLHHTTCYLEPVITHTEVSYNAFIP